MSKSRVARNVLWNSAGLAVPLAAGFLLAPLMIRHLGTERNGLWVLVLLWMDSFNLLDLGIGGSVGRSIAFHRARGETEAVRSALSTSFVMLCIVGAVVLAGTMIAPLLFFECNSVPAVDAPDVQAALVLIGVSVAVTAPLSVFDGSLWALQRFDISNAIDIPIAILRALLMLLMVWAGCGLAALALLALLARVGGSSLKAWCCFRIDSTLRIRADAVSRAAARGLFGYGIWSFVLTITRMLGERIGPQVISTRFGVALVTPQSVAAKLVGYSNGLMIAGTEVLTPVATHHHAGNKHNEQQELVLTGGKVCLALAIFFAGLFLLLGHEFLNLWVGPSVGSMAFPLLAILILGELLPMSQWLNYTTALAMNRHRGLALICLAEIIVAIGCSIWLSEVWGVAGACLGVAVPAALFRGVGQILYGCHLVRISVATYAMRSIVPGVMAACPAVITLALLQWWRSPTGWLALCLFGAAYTLVFALSAAWFFVWLEPTRRRWTQLVGKFRQWTANPIAEHIHAD